MGRAAAPCALASRVRAAMEIALISFGSARGLQYGLESEGQDMKTTLVFMAAGFGSRFGGGVKQIEPVGPNGEVLMDYAVHDALRAGFDRVVFIIRRDIEEQFRSGVGRRVEKKCDVEYVHQELSDLPEGFSLPAGRGKPWGTGQAVLACRNVVREPFCVLNADDYYGPETFQRMHDWIARMNSEERGLKLCMAGYILGNTLSDSGAVTRGLCRVDAAGMLREIRETRGVVKEEGRPCVREGDGLRALDAETPVSMNIWGLPPAFMDYLAEEFPRFLRSLGAGDTASEFLLPSIVGEMVASGRGCVQVLPTQDRWFGMTYAQDKIEAQRRIGELIAAGVYPERL